jgi:hypothetical protein
MLVGVHPAIRASSREDVALTTLVMDGRAAEHRVRRGLSSNAMPPFPEDTDPKTWHRYFAIECNNRAWDLASRPRTDEEGEEMRSTAHAAAFHWRHAGEQIHHMRATMLLAEVYSLLGDGDSAIRYAHAMRDDFMNTEAPDWEMAFVHTIHAHAAVTGGDEALHATSYTEAVKALEAIADEEDRKIVQDTFDQVPPP